MRETSLAPGLLLAMPQLVDPNFSRAVVLMIEHDNSGSFGLVINQPSDLSAGDLLQNLQIDWQGDDDEVVWSGGPVMPTSGWILHAPVSWITDTVSRIEDGSTIAVHEGLSLSTSPEKLKSLAENPPERLRIILGYSGWGPGQLADEMARGSWLHADVTPELVFDTPADEMWETALRSLGIDPQTIVVGRGVH